MLRWILLLGLLGLLGWALWSTRLPPSIAIDLPDPPKAAEPVPVAQPVVERLMGLWTTPDSHFWSDNLRVGPPQVARDEHIPHGPRVAEQAGWTRPIESDRMRSSDWTGWLRRTLIGTGVSNPLDKSFATSGVLERALCGTVCPSALPAPPVPPPEPTIFDGGGISPSVLLTLDGLGRNDEEPIVYTGGDVYGQL